MTPLRGAIDFITGLPIDRDTRRARLLAARQADLSGCNTAGNVTSPL